MYDAARLIRPTHPEKEKPKREQFEQNKKTETETIKSPVDDEKKSEEKWRKREKSEEKRDSPMQTRAMADSQERWEQNIRKNQSISGRWREKVEKNGTHQCDVGSVVVRKMKR
jgi:hypothetical protein